jgi:ABC-2 type transport system permease protein
MRAIIVKELNSYLNSLIAYIVIGIFLLMSSLVFWVFPDSNVLDFGYADMGTFFEFSPYIFLFLIPALTMRLFSEEYRTGTIELLFTKPISNLSLILGKFFSALLIIWIALVPTIIFYVSVVLLGSPSGNIDTASVIGSYLGLCLLGACFAAVGILSSSLTSNQVIAFVISATVSYMLFEGLSQISQLFRGSIQYYIDFFSLKFHYSSLSRGVVDSRNVIFMLSEIVLILLLCHNSIVKKRA